MYQIEIFWDGRWIVLQTGFPTWDDAEGAASGWRRKHQCHGDPFRYSAVAELTPQERLDLAG